MTVLHRYIIRSFLKYFSIVLLMVVVIYLSIDFVGNIDKLIHAKLSIFGILLVFAYKIPLILSQITPVAVLLSVLIVFGLMNKNNEITALKSGGISMYYLVRPMVIIGITSSIALFLFTEVVVPFSITRSNQLAAGKQGNNQIVESREKNVWIRHQHEIIHVKYVNPSDQKLFGITIYSFGDGFKLIQRVDAGWGEYQNGKWMLHNCLVQSAKKGEADYTNVFHDRKLVSIGLVPSDFKRVVVDSEEMSFTGLWKYVHTLESEGYDATRYRVDLYSKIAFPLVCLIMCLFGSGIALRGKTKDGMAGSFAWGIITAALYWLVYSFCLSLGYGGVLPAWIAAWVANIIFCCAGGLVLMGID